MKHGRVCNVVTNALCWLLIGAGVLAPGFVRAVAGELPSPWHYRAYQTESGLPDISITGIAQTKDGYLWVATKGGLLCFNGETFSLVSKAMVQLLPSRSVRAMFRDTKDQIWVGMERGPLFCFKADGLASFSVEDGLARQRFLMLAEDREGAVWVAFPTQLRRIFNGQVQTIERPEGWLEEGDFQLAGDLAGNVWCAKGYRLALWREGKWQSELRMSMRIGAVSAGGQSNLWLCAGSSLYALAEGGDPRKVVELPPELLPTVLLEDRTGAVWLGGAAGLFRFDGGRVERVPTSDRDITCIFEDQEGNLWVGTAGGGLNLIRLRTASLLGPEIGLPFESVQSVTEDARGWLWAASQDGLLACRRDGQWELVSANTNWPGGNADCVAADSIGGVYVGSDRGLKHFRDGAWRQWRRREGLASDAVRSLLVASNGDVWVATAMPNRLHRLRDGLVTQINSSNRLGPIRAMTEGRHGTIWIGTADGEILRVSKTALVGEPAITEPVPLSVRTLLATADGRLWIGYAGDGLGHLQDGKYHRLTTAAGLADDFVSQLLTDENGNLWLTGNRGLSRISIAELDSVITGQAQRVSARAYGSVDGLPAMQPNRDNSPSAWHGRDGRLWFCMHSGLLEVQPDYIIDNPYQPPVQLERVTVDDQFVAVYNADSPLQAQPATNCLNLRGLTRPIQLGPGHRKLEIDFAALSYTSPENVHFRYRLSGFDASWVEVGSTRRATYPRLRAGNYEFQVAACNNSGVWNETGAKVLFAVSPFFWETWWFRIGGGLATAGAAAGLALMVSRRRYRQKLRRLEARRALEQERARIARDIHDDLGASLTRISLLSQPSRIEAEDLPAAVANLTQIHHTARDLTHAMGEVVWAVNPEHDTFDSLANYVSHFAQNFLKTAGVRCRIEVPLNLPKRPLSAEIRHNLFLAFKEALNNVVKHSGATEVRISLAPGGAGFELTVQDNGRGFTEAAVAAQTDGADATRSTPGNGLANMQNRLREIGGTCEIQSRPGTGTRVTFSLRLAKDHEQP